MEKTNIHIALQRSVSLCLDCLPLIVVIVNDDDICNEEKGGAVEDLRGGEGPRMPNPGANGNSLGLFAAK